MGISELSVVILVAAAAVRWLVGFQRVHLKAGESKTVKFTVSPRQRAFYDDRLGAWVAQGGEFVLSVVGGQPASAHPAGLEAPPVPAKSIQVTGRKTVLEAAARKR